MPKRLWTVAVCARAWGVDRRRVYELIKAGRVPAAYRDGAGSWRIPVGTPKPDESTRTRGPDRTPRTRRKSDNSLTSPKSP